MIGLSFAQYVADPGTWVAIGVMVGLVALVAIVLWDFCDDV